jgi:hypothetical protein
VPGAGAPGREPYLGTTEALEVEPMVAIGVRTTISIAILVRSGRELVAPRALSALAATREASSGREQQ